MRRRTVSVVPLLILAACAPALATDDVQVHSVLVKLSEQVEVPARVAGVLEKISVREGDMIAEAAPLAQIEDADAKLEKRRAQIELAGASKQADSDVKVRYAKKSLEVAEAELRRALDSQRRLAQSVSESELDRLRLLAQKSSLEIEQAKLELELARSERDLKENDLQVAEHDITQRRVTAPLAGFVAQVNRHAGEWVQPGQTILRILRLDRLRAEGLVSSQAVATNIKGRKVTLTVELDGRKVEFPGEVVFVSPEIDPVNGQVRIWAEIDNANLQLRPGLHGSMTISGASPVSGRP
jgi:multidrug efflux pump subunit AcrA (membrane-fusion protein)